MMSILFREVISKLSNHTILQVVNPHLEVVYQEARLLSQKWTDLSPKTIYVGEASQVSAQMQQRRDIGLILINNCDFDFSLLQGNAVELAAQTDLNWLFNDVLEAFHSKRRIVDSAAALLECLVQGKGLNDLIQIGAQIIGNPVSLVDYTGKLLAVSNQQEIDKVDLTPEGYLTQEIYSIFRTHNYTKRVNESLVPILLDIEHPNIPRMIVGKIVTKNKIVGHLAVIENEQPFVDDDIEITRILIDAIASEVQKNNHHLVMAGIQHEYFILDLLQEKHENPATIEDRIRSLQWDAYHDFYVVTIHIPRKDDAFFFVEYFRARLGHIFPFSKSIYYDENVILVIYKERDVQKIIKNLDTILLENKLIAGISLRFSSIIELKSHYQQAKFAINIGKLLRKDEHIFLYDDLYLYDILTILNRHANLKDFCHPCIKKIKKYDEVNGTDYYSTLYEYLMSGANMAQVAKKLYIHRNTLYHRINKISEIIEMDLDNGDDYLKLLLSYKIMELYDAGVTAPTKD